jgi:hypothetical protein
VRPETMSKRSVEAPDALDTLLAGAWVIAVDPGSCPIYPRSEVAARCKRCFATVRPLQSKLLALTLGRRHDAPIDSDQGGQTAYRERRLRAGGRTTTPRALRRVEQTTHVWTGAARRHASRSHSAISTESAKRAVLRQTSRQGARKLEPAFSCARPWPNRNRYTRRRHGAVP